MPLLRRLRTWVFALLLFEASSEETQLRTYRITPRSIAVLVPAVHSHAPSANGEVELVDAAAAAADHENAESLQKGQRWWWFAAAKDGGDAKKLPWKRLLKSFGEESSVESTLAVGQSMLFGETNRLMAGGAASDAKVATVLFDSENFAFRAFPQSMCNNRSSPPGGSFMPEVLPHVPEGFCVVELIDLDPSTKYRLSLFNIRDGSSPPEHEPKHALKGTAETTAASAAVDMFSHFMFVLCVLSTLCALIWNLWLNRELIQKTQILKSASHELELNLTNDNDNDEEDSTDKVLLPTTINQDVLSGGYRGNDDLLRLLHVFVRAMTMFLPIIGPPCFALTSDVTIGSRIKNTNAAGRAFFASGRKEGRLNFWRNLFGFAVNLILTPINLYFIQMMWFSYGNWYSRIGLDVAAVSSFSSFQRQYRCWDSASGIEIVGWIPAVVLSIVMLGASHAGERNDLFLEHQRSRVLQLLRQAPKGSSFYKCIRDVEDSPFKPKKDTVSVPQRAFFMLVAVLFGVLPHLWMVWRHGVSLFTNGVMWITALYMVNVTGVSHRFMERALKIYANYRHGVHKLTFFQAISWKETKTSTIYDPFVTRRQGIDRVRTSLQEGEHRITPLNLEDPTESKVWWHLRELMLNELQAGRLQSECLILLGVFLSVYSGALCFILMSATHVVTATTIVSTFLMSMLVCFSYSVVKRMRDINLMANEHIGLLHVVVAETNMPLRPQRPLDSHLMQERFLLELATLIERQRAPETMASFTVTPQLFSGMIGGLVVLYLACVTMLFRGLTQLAGA